MISRRNFCIILGGAAEYLRQPPESAANEHPADSFPSSLEKAFLSPPDSARPYVLWMWMGSNVSQSGITRDLEAMKEAGIGGATIFSLADTTTPWAGMILKSPTPEIVTFTEPWWRMVHHACSEARRLGLELILHNCAGYESSGGPWITPELSMQELIWSELRVKAGAKFSGALRQQTVDLHPHAQFPDVYIPALGKVDKPIVEARRTFYRDIAVLAAPADGAVAKEKIVDLSSRMGENGELEWNAPDGNGDWTVYRFGHTTTGAMIQPAQWDAMGMECDKLSAEAVTFHVQHVLAGIKQHLGDLAGATMTTLYFDSYEAGEPTWTSKMREEFQSRRGYALTPWLAALAGRIVDSEEHTVRFKNDFKRTVFDLFRDCYWSVASRLTRDAGLQFGAEPYEGPWEISEVVKFLDKPTAEFWTHDNRYSPVDVEPVVTAARLAGRNVISAEAFTSDPKLSRWNEHPAWLKPIGDAAFCAGINRLSIHHFVQQPWDDQFKPGNTMGQWGIHFGRNQTWWKPGQAWLAYLWRCQALLQLGAFVPATPETTIKFEAPKNGPEIKSIRRSENDAHFYFLANVTFNSGKVQCVFPQTSLTPELWDPVQGTMRELTERTHKDNATVISIDFAPAQSFFIVFRHLPSHGAHVPGSQVQRAQVQADFPALSTVAQLDGPWHVAFDPQWGGPQSAVFEQLTDWTSRQEPGIKYYSGTAVYKKIFDFSPHTAHQRIFLDLGGVKHLAAVTLNGVDLGVLWTAPWRLDVSRAIKTGKNTLELAVTNVWANRLIGDEQQPPDCTFVPGDIHFKAGDYLKEFPDWFLKGEKRPSPGRFTFATWNSFTKDSPLEPSGLLGPVKLLSAI